MNKDSTLFYIYRLTHITPQKDMDRPHQVELLYAANQARDNGASSGGVQNICI
jgi:hypothetical protein